jgi:hypothetical protein
MERGFGSVFHWVVCITGAGAGSAIANVLCCAAAWFSCAACEGEGEQTILYHQQGASGMPSHWVNASKGVERLHQLVVPVWVHVWPAACRSWLSRMYRACIE